MKSKNITEMLEQWSAGDKTVQNELFEAVYHELHLRARGSMRKENPGHILQPTALINEMFTKLANFNRINWQNREHFYATAAIVMRRVLVDFAREKLTERRGGGVSVESLEDQNAVTAEDCQRLIDINLAVERLAEVDGEAHDVFNLRYFVGLTIDETADILKISTATVSRKWESAKTWLQSQLN